MKKFLRFLLLLCFVTLASTTDFTSCPNPDLLDDIVNVEASSHNIMVWVHGTNIRALSPSAYLVSNPVKIELIPFSKIRKGSKGYKRAFSFYQNNPTKHPLSGYYIFRWSGLLGDSRRWNASVVLFESLKKESDRIYQEHSVYPKITICTHSHGGNVVLNLAQINMNRGCNLTIDKLVLLACPVINSTSSLLRDTTFKKVYSFYSVSDYIQLLAMQGFINFSGRKFAPNKKLTQVHVSSQKSGICHNDFKGTFFAKHLPDFIDIVDQAKLNSSHSADCSLNIKIDQNMNFVYRFLGF
jgi:hypothetical protein